MYLHAQPVAVALPDHCRPEVVVPLAGGHVYLPTPFVGYVTPLFLSLSLTSVTLIALHLLGKHGADEKDKNRTNFYFLFKITFDLHVGIKSLDLTHFMPFYVNTLLI